MKRHSMSLFITYFIPYLGFLLLLIIMTGVYYYSSQRLVQQEAMDHTLQKLEQSAYLGDLRMSELESVVTSLSTDSRINEFLKIKSFSGAAFYQFIDFWQDIPTYSITEEFLIDYVIYSNSTQAMISKYGADAEVETFYDSLYSIPDMDFTLWKNQYLKHYQTMEIQGSRPVTINNSTLSGITMYQTLPIGYQNINEGTIILVVDPALFSSPITGTENNQTWYYIADHQGNRLVSHSTDELEEIFASIEHDSGTKYALHTIAGKEWFIAHTVSDIYGWIYTMGVEKSAVLGNVYQIRNFSIMLISIVFTLGVIVAVVLTRINSNPIRKILTVLPDEFSKQDSSGIVQQIGASIQQMKLRNTSMSNALKTQQPLLQAQLIGKILRGGFSSEQELLENMHTLSLSISTGLHLACIIRVENSSCLETSKLQEEKIIIRSIIEEIAGSSVLMYDWDNDKLAILFTVDSDQNKDHMHRYIETILGGIKKVLASKHKIQVLCSGGSIYNDLSQVYRSAAEAEDVLNYATSLWTTQVCWFDDELEDNEQYYFPLELEQRLINLIRAAESEKAVQVIQELFHENIENRVLSVHMMLLFGNEIFSTLMKSAGRISSKIERTSSFSFSQHVEELHGWRRNIRETKNLAPIRDMVIHLCKTICDLVQQQRQHPKNILSSRFLSFLAEHKNNPELCLTMMADHFNLTEAYISHMFREQTGEKFSSCLEKIRISEATELLKRDYLIDEIVTMTGYQYKNTFYKAFKRVMHVSPGQYRENILQNARKSDR